MSAPLLFSFFVTLFFAILFLAVWRLVPQRDPVEERLAEYGYTSTELDSPTAHLGVRSLCVGRLLNGFSLGPRLAMSLSQADLPLTAAEFSLIMLGAGALGFSLGTLRLHVIAGLLLGALFAYIPMLYLRVAQSRRRRALTNQLPDVLTLLIGALRAGYGLNQAIELLVDQLPAPSSKEFARVLRAVNLGVAVPRALTDMAQRVGSDDLDLVVTAINVQYELGGNLATVLETISETVRERIRILREIRVLTAQQRFTGYVLAGLPIFLVIAISIISPGYFDAFFEPGLIRLVPLAGILFMLTGFFLIRRIVDIEV